MKSMAGKLAKGLGIGLAIGGAVGLIGGAAAKPGYQRSAKKSFNKALKTVGTLLQTLS